MSVTSQPITPESFLRAIRDLELEQLHAESARLNNSIFHLRRSNVALAEFPDEPACQEAIAENEEVVRRQLERVDMIREEVERRGFRMGHGEEEEGEKVNGVEGREGEESGIGLEGAERREGAPEGGETRDGGGGGVTEAARETEEEEGVYL
ncbi:hypothetical protein RUND412_008702 [Rhizina undulata]